MISNYVLIFGSTTFSNCLRAGNSCELISNYVLIFGSTTKWFDRSVRNLLWIDFKLCSYFWFDNIYDSVAHRLNVVNWFQIMFLFLVRQRNGYSSSWDNCCELISNYVLIFGSTTALIISSSLIPLWIDFKLCSYFWFDNGLMSLAPVITVVNWFQIMFLFLVRQHFSPLWGVCNSCELISNYVLIFGSTTFAHVGRIEISLWIDFKLCSYFWFDNFRANTPKFALVVNWFQIMFLFLVRQPPRNQPKPTHSCELISNYVLIFGSTTELSISISRNMLWIDFKLCSYFWFDNWSRYFNGVKCVVNWFQIMFLFLVRQLYLLVLRVIHSCELISNYVLIFGSTTINIAGSGRV